MWSKEDTKKYRQLIKERKTQEDIINYFGEEKLKENPYWRYGKDNRYGGIMTYEKFIYELKLNPNKIKYHTITEKSKIFNGYFNYNSFFKLDSGNEYVLNYIYLKDTIGNFAGKDLYNISFSTKEQYDEYLRTGNYKKYENLSNKHEFIQLMKALSFIIFERHKYIIDFYKEIFYVIGVTDDVRKIEIYRKLISDSFKNVIETLGESSFNLGKEVYYYRIIEI